MMSKNLYLLSLSTAMAIILPSTAFAQEQQPQASAPGTVDCSQQGCVTETGDVLLQVKSRGEQEPVTAPSTPATSEALQPDRRVTIDSAEAKQKPGKVVAIGKWSMQLPNGGIIWATEDPTLGAPQMSVSAVSLIPFDGQRITKPVRFMTYSNYPAFVKRAEILVFRASDVDFVEPLATIPLPVAAVSEAEWDGSLPSGFVARQGDELVYIVRAYGEHGNLDETFPRRFQLVSPEEAARGFDILRTNLEKQVGQAVQPQDAEERSLVEGVFGQNSLRVQNIPIYGSRIRIQGRNLPAQASVTIDGQSHPVDQERKFVAEYLMPVGSHKFDIAVKAGQSQLRHALDVDVSGRYMFAVALADLTLSGNSVSGSVEPVAGDENYSKDLLAEGRLAFYLKGKIKGKYLITAQADTRNREVSDLFRGFWKADPVDIFRRLDPDQYYPVYGDDSVTTRDVDTMGRLYVRVDWDKNQALWGNYNTGITGTEYGQYSRALYGGAASLRSRRSTDLGEAGSHLKVFGSQAQTAPGHSEFIGTGGSLYYMKHTDLLPGSDRVILEIRDSATGRVENRVDLVRGADYEIDEMQGRIMLTRPLLQVTRENVRTLTRDVPLDGYSQRLLVDYEYVPRGFDPNDMTFGARGKHWFGNHLAVGGTYVEENRAGDDYNMVGGDITLQAGRGTYIKAEHTRTKATSAPVYFSDNGGLSFERLNPLVGSRKGDASAIEARANFKELGVTNLDWSAGAWWRKVDAGFSVSRFDMGREIEEYGAEVLGQFAPNMNIYGKYSHAKRDAESLIQAQLTGEWRMNDKNTLSAEIRRVEEHRIGGDAAGLLGALQYKHRVGSHLDLYGTAQVTLDDDGGRYQDNNALTVGAKYQFADLSTVGAEATTGDRGDAVQVNGEYRLNPNHTLYGSYTYSTDRTYYDGLFNPRLQNGWTLGQRWRLSNQVNLFNESQFLKTPTESGIAHTFGMDFYPATGWNLGFTVQRGELEKQIGQVRRTALSLNGGRTSNRTQWQSKAEWRRDTGAEQREQWVTTNTLMHKVDESLRLAARFNYSKTTDDILTEAGAKFIEGNVGFAYRPWNNTKWALFGRYTYLYDVSSLPQIGDNVAFYDQKSHVASFEGIYHPSQKWEFAGKLARREGEVRYGRLQGQWADSAVTFAAAQVRYGITTDWNLLGEYRWLGVKHGGDRHGALIGIDRDIGENLRIGVGYNFTNFSDNLTNQDYDHKGWFLNIVGKY